MTFINSRFMRWYGTLSLAALMFVLAFGAVAWRLAQAPDVFSDEILYTRAGIRVATEGALVWDSGLPVYVHPPLYFLLEGAYLRLTSDLSGAMYNVGDVFAWVYHARYLNAVLAGLTAILLFMIGKRMRGVGLGVLFALLFIIDPFGVRTNRRAMLETLAVLTSTAGIGLLLTERLKVTTYPSIARALAAGLLLGAGLLVKELTFTVLLAVFAFGLWELREGRRLAAVVPIFLTVLIAGLTYSIYPLWELALGAWNDFISVKALTLARLMGLVQLSGWNRPGVSFTQLLEQRLFDYGPTFLIFALGGLSTAWLTLMHRRDRMARLLSVWGLILYPFYAFVTLFGAGNDQFFYFLLIPAILLIGYAASVMPEDIQSFLAHHTKIHLGDLHPIGRKLNWVRTLSVLMLLAVLIPYNAARWWMIFGSGQDNGYYQLTQYVRDHLPANAAIGTSGDASKFRYFFPARPIVNAATLQDIEAAGVHYFAIAPKDVWAHYSQMTPELAAWIEANGMLLYSTSDTSYGDINLYLINIDNNALPAARSATLSITRQSYTTAQGGFVIGFVFVFAGWCVGVMGMMVASMVGRRVSSRSWHSAGMMRRFNES